jgi:cell wall-associated NlpC family hydrolase
MGQPRAGAHKCGEVRRAAEAQEIELLSKHYPITRHRPTTELHGDVVPHPLAKPANFRRKSSFLSVAVCALVVPGLLATVALPAYGAGTAMPGAHNSSASTAPGTNVDEQSLQVAASATPPVSIEPASFSVTAPVVRAAAPPAPSATAYLANPPYPNFDLAAVPSVASRYLGVPYVFGGESPAGFDCSGLVAYVYAQFGIRLPHSSAQQGRIGTKIARSAALPGDVVVMDGGSHVGIYIGGGRMIDAPMPGRVVSNDAIYDNNYYFVRFGI